jgi:glycine C-acetyltransferase
MDLFQKLNITKTPLGQYSEEEGYYIYPRLEGPIGNHMSFQGREMIVWSVNNYLGLANHPEVRETDEKAAREWGSAAPMGSRLMSGNTQYHEELEQKLAQFVGKESGFLVNFGYQGILSAIDAVLDRKDVLVYDKNCHACIVDGARLHMGKRFVYEHNDIDSLKRNLERATKVVEETGGGILVVSEGVFGMLGHQGKIREIADLKDRYDFRLMVDDAHGFGTLGENGAGVGEEQNVTDEIDLYFATFAKSMASIGAFFASKPEIINYLKYNMRSQIFAKSLPMPIVIGGLKRLELIQKHPEFKQKLWKNATALQEGLKEHGFYLGDTNSAITPVILKGGVPEAIGLTHDLRENHNVFCSIVVYPVVPKGTVLLRLIPTAEHTQEDIEQTIHAFRSVKDKLEKGIYAKESKYSQ